MPTRRVRALADELALELERGELDEASRDALDALRGHVDRALEGEELEEPPSKRARSLRERLEVDHPDLSALIHRLTDALAAAGL